MEVCKELKVLADEFNKKCATLYIVGGGVRDYLLDFKSSDIDITSTLSQEDVLEICSKLQIKATKINKHLGTISLNFNNQKFEYTRFRKESYGKKGNHTPDSVEFIDDINVDARRRDFTINAIYYDIANDKLVDPLNGIKDIQKKVIRTTCDPEVTLSDDGLRILRCIRFASAFYFKIERQTRKALKKFTPLLNSISKERILKELSLIVNANYQYGENNKVFLELSNYINLPKYIFNSSLDRMKKFNRNDIDNFYVLDKSSRLIGFYILVLKNYLKNYTPDTQLSYQINMLLGVNGIKESSEHIRITEKLYRIYQNIEFKKDELNACVNYLTLSSAERNIIDVFLSKKAKTVLSDKISYVKDQKLPLSVHELDICVQDLLDMNIERKYISKILSTLYNQVLNMSIPNENWELKNMAVELDKLFKNITKERV